uniref:Nitroreductase domain-containing protein n=1 Tax=Lotharella oceanica TaxID=641309 RepID=A0A7S2TMF8_9EUKA
MAAALLRAQSTGRVQKGQAEEEKKHARAPNPPVSQVEKLIASRRSIFPKDYNGKAVPRGVIERMLEAANWAPTHGKTEPWRFVVISGEGIGQFTAMKNEENLEFLVEGSVDWEHAMKKIARKQKELGHVSHLIAICLKRVVGKKGKPMPEWEEISSVAMAVQNMHLVATAGWVAGYWSSGGWNKALASERVKSFLGIDAADRCLGLFHVGMSDKIARYRRKPGSWEDKVTWVCGPVDAKPLNL